MIYIEKRRGFAKRMEISYKNLWKMLIDRDLKKVDLQTAAGLAANTMTRLRKNEPVSMEVLWRICTVLGCNIEDVMEFVLPKEDII